MIYEHLKCTFQEVENYFKMGTAKEKFRKKDIAAVKRHEEEEKGRRMNIDAL